MSDNSEYSSEWINVTAGEHSQGNRVAIYEEDYRHPDGQVFIYGDKVAQAYPTDEVLLRMREGFLKEQRGQRSSSQEQKKEEVPLQTDEDPKPRSRASSGNKAE